MTDDLNDLKSMMDAATARPDPARRAENLALAQENFAALQGSRDAARPTPVTGPWGLWTGVKTMLDFMTSRGALTATTAIVAVGFVTLTPVGQDLWRTAPTVVGGSVTEATVDAEVDKAIAEADANFTTAEIAVQEEDEAVDMDDMDVAEPAPMPTGVAQAPAEPRARRQEAPLSAVAPQTQAEGAGVAAFSGLSSLTGEAPQALTRIAPAPSDDSASSGMEMVDRNGQRPNPNSPVFFGGQPPDDAVQIVAPNSPNTEAFPVAADNPLKITQETPVSTFSIDVDTAAYSLVRNSLTRGQMPPRNAVRVEELINYFPYDYPAPDAGEAPFRPTVSTFQTPWNADTQLVHIALQGIMPAVEARPPLNLVFLIDTSGSMNDPAKLPLLKQSFRLMLDNLRPEDEIAIVEYAGSAGQVLAPTAASDRATILRAINGLGAGGSTNGQGGLEQAYAVADGMVADGEVNRVILATDGDFNVGINNPNALKDFIADKRDTGTYLSVLGFGRGNLDDATMQALAQNGNGTAAYIDTLSEAQKVLVDQLTGALFTIAGDVKIQVEWNPAEIAEYRLIGYETRALNREDFNNDAVDAGELGAGHAVTAIYEVTPVGSPAQLSDPLRYQPEQVAETTGELGFLKLRYKDPGADNSQLLETPITANSGASTEAQFAAAIAGFGQLLRDNPYLGDWSYMDAIALANAHKGDDPFGYRTEAVQLMRLAQSLSR